ncbi:MAG: hypothetical protein WKF89_01460 [Chitinophagaceae bacterium]
MAKAFQLYTIEKMMLIPDEHTPDQLNPGAMDQFGNESVIKKNEGIGEQGNEWADKEGFSANPYKMEDEKGERYLRESADIEDLPDEDDSKELEKTNKDRNAAVVDDNDTEEANDVIEDEDEQVPGYDIGRHKVQ